jgi:hypothetical protein
MGIRDMMLELVNAARDVGLDLSDWAQCTSDGIEGQEKRIAFFKECRTDPSKVTMYKQHTLITHNLYGEALFSFNECGRATCECHSNKFIVPHDFDLELLFNQK